MMLSQSVCCIEMTLCHCALMERPGVVLPPFPTILQIPKGMILSLSFLSFSVSRFELEGPKCRLHLTFFSMCQQYQYLFASISHGISLHVCSKCRKPSGKLEFHISCRNPVYMLYDQFYILCHSPANNAALTIACFYYLHYNEVELHVNC